MDRKAQAVSGLARTRNGSTAVERNRSTRRADAIPKGRRYRRDKRSTSAAQFVVKKAAIPVADIWSPCRKSGRHGPLAVARPGQSNATSLAQGTPRPGRRAARRGDQLPVGDSSERITRPAGTFG